MTVYIAPISRGLGDLVLSLPAIQWLIASGEPTILVMRSERQAGFESLIPGLAGYVMESDFDSTKLSKSDRYINLRDHPLQSDYLWGGPEFEQHYPGYRIADIISGICKDMGIDADFTDLIPLPYLSRVDARGKIIFIPGTFAAYKCWPIENWRELYDLLIERQEQVLVMGQPESSPDVAALIDHGLPWVETPTLQDALNVLSSARAVVSVDTGLMHLAVHQRVPVTALYTSLPGTVHFMRRMSNCYQVVSPSCAPECINVELAKDSNAVTEWKSADAPYDLLECRAKFQSRCMNRIPVLAVLRQLEEALAGSLSRDLVLD